MAAAISFSLFDSVSRNLTSTVSGSVQRGITSGFNAASQGSGSHLASTIANSVSNGIQRGVSSFAIRGAESIEAGREVVGNAVEAANQKAGEILNNAVGKISQWQTFLTQHVLGGISGALTRFVGVLSNVLGGAPGRIVAMIAGLFGAGSGAMGRMGGAGGILMHLLRAPGRLLGGAGVGAFTSRYDARTGRYHNIFNNLMVPMAEGRAQFAGILGGLWARIREWIANLANGIAGVFRGLLAGARTAFSVAWAAVTTAVGVMVDGIAQTLTRMPAAIAPLLLGALAAGGFVMQVVSPLVVALRTVIGTAISAVGTVIGNVITQAAAMATRAWGVVAPIMGRFFGALGNMFMGGLRWILGAAGSAGRFLGNMASSVGSWVSGVVQGAIGFARTFLSNLFAFMRGSFMIGAAIVGMGLFAKAVYEAAKSAMEFAKSAQLLAATSGRSFSSSAGLLFGGRAVGISEGSMQKAFGDNAMLTRIRGAIWGVNATEISSVAARFQSLMRGGFFGQMMAQAMVKNLGMDSPDFQQALMQKPGAIAQNQAYQQNLFARMGFNPASLQKYAEEIPMLLGRIGVAWDAIKMKLATIALPIIERLGNALAGWVTDNADSIVGWLNTVTDWIVTKAPVMLANGLSMVTGVMQAAVGGVIGALGAVSDWLGIAGEAVLTFGLFLAENLPNWLGAAADWVANMMRGLAGLIAQYGPVVAEGARAGLANIGTTVANWLRGLGEALYQLHLNKNNPLRGLMEGIATTLDGIVEVFRWIGAAMAEAFNLVKIAAYSNPLSAWQYRAGTGDTTAPVLPGFASARFFNDNPSLGLGDRMRAFFDNPDGLPKWANSLSNIADGLERRMGNYGDAAAGAINNFSGWSAGALNGGANWLAPEGRPDLNVGRMAGNWAGGLINNGLIQVSSLMGTARGLVDNAKGFMDGTVKPGADAIAAASNAFGGAARDFAASNGKMDKMVEGQNKLANAMQGVANKIAEGNADQRSMIGFLRTGGRIGSYLSEDAALNITRVNG